MLAFVFEYGCVVAGGEACHGFNRDEWNATLLHTACDGQWCCRCVGGGVVGRMGVVGVVVDTEQDPLGRDVVLLAQLGNDIGARHHSSSQDF